MCDIVYILREGANEELKYSLRSLENFPKGRVVFVGGCPEGLKPDLYIPAKQTKDKWGNACDLLKLACKDKRLSEDIILFNDDFFVMKPIDNLPVYRNRTLGRLAKFVTRDGRRRNGYIETRILPTIKALQDKGLTFYNYELHLPMKINRQKMLRVIRLFPNCAKRSCYGNYYRIGGREIDPVHLNDGSVQSLKNGFKENRIFISTTDESWQGVVGRQIKERFPNPSKYESYEV